MFEAMEYSHWDEAEQKATSAYELYEDDQINLALERITEAIEMNPNNSAWHFNAGLALDSLGRFEDAVVAYQQAIKLGGQDPEILNSLAVDYTRIRQYDLAIATFEQIQQIDPTFEPCYCNRIITYTEMDCHNTAEQMFYLAQQINPDCPICFYNIGNSLFSRQQYKKAIWCWEKTAVLEPNHPQINYRIAQAYWANGDMEPAHRHFLQELRENPGDIDVILDFGLFLLKCGNQASAREKFNRILELSPDSAAAVFYLGEIAFNRGDTAGAERLFRKALRKDRKLLGSRYRLAQIAAQRGNDTEAVRLLLDEFRLDVRDCDVLFSMGTMLIHLGELERAADCFLKILDDDRQHTEAFYHLGIALAQKAEFPGALQFFEHALSLGATKPELLADTALLYLKMGRLTDAARTVAAACELAGDDKNLIRLRRQIKLAALVGNIKKLLLTNKFLQNAH